MCNKLFLIVVLALLLIGSSNGDSSASDLVNDIYADCLSELSTKCIKPKLLSWISSVADNNVIHITDNLSIVKNHNEELSSSSGRNSDPIADIINKFDSFITTHSLKIIPVSYLRTEQSRSIIPKWLLQGGLAEDIQIPLVDGNAVEGRGFVRKVMIPFLLGLKFKTTILVPLALALIALKTWKAMTLGLLSLVLSGAIVIFKLVKPNVHNYEVVHYPPAEHYHHLNHLHIDPHHLDHRPLEHIHLDHHHIDHHPVEHFHVDRHQLDHQHLEHHIDHLDGHLDHSTDHHVEHIIQPVNQGWEPKPQDWS